MPHDLLTAVRVEGLRAVGSLGLTLRGASVLLGPSGAGKSSLADALSVLRACPSRGFGVALSGQFGGARALGAGGAGDAVVLEVDFAGAGEPLRYRVSLGERDGGSAVLAESLERLDVPEGDAAREVLARQGGTARYRVEGEALAHPLAVPPQSTALSAFGPSPPHSALRRAARVLETIRVHRGGGEPGAAAWSGARAAEALACAARGVPGLRAVVVRDAGDARGPWLEFHGREALAPAASLPGCQRAWLALVALAFEPAVRSVAVLDEPAAGLDGARAAEVHATLARAAEAAPVLLLTHDARAVELAGVPWPAAQVHGLDHGDARGR